MQKPLFQLAALDRRSVNTKSPVDAQSEDLLRLYRRRRPSEGCSGATVEKEVSQLKSLFREAQRRNFTPSTIFRNPGILSDILLHPSTWISASAGRTRLIAAHRFVALCGADVEVPDAHAFMSSLDALLPSKGNGSWHDAGTIVAGAKSRRRPRNPTLSPAELKLLVEKAFPGSNYRDIRNRSLLALHCFTGLHPREIVTLKTRQLFRDHEPTPMLVEVWRSGRPLRLRIINDAMFHLKTHLANQPPVGPEGYVFPRGRCDPKPLTSRAVRDTVREACSRVGVPAMTAAELRSAFAYYLRASGLSDHEVASVLGVRKVRTVDRLLARHLEHDAQRRVHEILPTVTMDGAPNCKG